MDDNRELFDEIYRMFKINFDISNCFYGCYYRSDNILRLDRSRGGRCIISYRWHEGYPATLRLDRGRILFFCHHPDCTNSNNTWKHIMNFSNFEVKLLK